MRGANDLIPTTDSAPPGAMSVAVDEWIRELSVPSSSLETRAGARPSISLGGRAARRGAGASSSPTVLVADDDADVLEALGYLLSGLYTLTFARDGREAVTALCLWPFDLAIVDLALPVVDAFQLLEAIHASDHPQSPAVLLLSGEADPRAKVRALALGAVDYVTKPFDSEELLARVARSLATVAREASLSAAAMTDPLTGLANYRSFSQSLDRELERSRRYHLPLSLIILDLDHLKAINDEHGHDAGNDAIRQVARVLASTVRRFEVVARQGGDEFAVILPSTGAADALRLAERLRGEISGHSVRGVKLSASLGVASGEEAPLAAAALIKASDDALYRAKRDGRDRVAVETL
jgi:two-component system cell cycle response regulator